MHHHAQTRGYVLTGSMLSSFVPSLLRASIPAVRFLLRGHAGLVLHRLFGVAVLVVGRPPGAGCALQAGLAPPTAPAAPRHQCWITGGLITARHLCCTTSRRPQPGRLCRLRSSTSSPHLHRKSNRCTSATGSGDRRRRQTTCRRISTPHSTPSARCRALSEALRTRRVTLFLKCGGR